jgi:hypothetical protein
LFFLFSLRQAGCRFEHCRRVAGWECLGKRFVQKLVEMTLGLP